MGENIPATSVLARCSLDTDTAAELAALSVPHFSARTSLDNADSEKGHSLAELQTRLSKLSCSGQDAGSSGAHLGRQVAQEQDPSNGHLQTEATHNEAKYVLKPSEELPSHNESKITRIFKRERADNVWP